MWIIEQGIPPYGKTDEARLPSSPSTQITAWQGYDINGYRFHMKEKDKKSAAQNSGVRYKGIDEGTMETKAYYGQIEEIWELHYGDDLQIPIFQC
jgi:hypothetical protein